MRKPSPIRVGIADTKGWPGDLPSSSTRFSITPGWARKYAKVNA